MATTSDETNNQQPEHPALAARKERASQTLQAQEEAARLDATLHPNERTDNNTPKVTPDGRIALTPDMFRSLLAAAKRGNSLASELESVRAQLQNAQFVQQLAPTSTPTAPLHFDNQTITTVIVDEQPSPYPPAELTSDDDYTTLDTSDEPTSPVSQVVATHQLSRQEAVWQLASTVLSGDTSTQRGVELPNSPEGPVHQPTRTPRSHWTSDEDWAKELTIDPVTREERAAIPHTEPAEHQRHSQPNRADELAADNERELPERRKHNAEQAKRPVLGQSYDSFFAQTQARDVEAVERNERWHAERGKPSPQEAAFDANRAAATDVLAFNPPQKGKRVGSKQGRANAGVGLNPLLSPHSNVQTDLWLAEPLRYKEMYEAALDAMRLRGPWRTSLTTAFTPTAMHIICTALEAGSSRTAACAFAGIGASQLEYLRKQSQKGAEPYRTITDLFSIAEGRIEMRLSTTWAKAGMTDWQAGAAFLAKRFSEQWGDKKVLELAARDLRNLSTEQLTEIVGEEVAREILEVTEETTDDDDFDFDTTPIDDKGNAIVMPRDDDAPDPTRVDGYDPDPNYTTPITFDDDDMGGYGSEVNNE